MHYTMLIRTFDILRNSQSMTTFSAESATLLNLLANADTHCFLSNELTQFLHRGDDSSLGSVCNRSCPVIH